MEQAPKSRAEMIGDALREVGVLAAVFIPLDWAFSSEPVLPLWGVVVATVFYGGGFFVVGMLVEEARE